METALEDGSSLAFRRGHSLTFGGGGHVTFLTTDLDELCSESPEGPDSGPWAMLRVEDREVEGPAEQTRA